jgi:peptide-methionine (S)-S-oxide reductase
MEPPFDKLPGVSSTTSGYTGGKVASPSYEQVSAGATGHIESVQILYDPKKVSYRQLLDVYWKNIDPFDGTGQFCDKGPQYRSAIFYHDEEERRSALETKLALEKRFGRRIATEIVPAGAFWPAEDYHQNYYEKNPVRYKFYRNGCGRDRRLREVWGP